MKLTEFRISMYKGILDTDWVDVENLTVLVGKNESGKTSLLKALHKLNPYSSELYDIKNEWPRSRLSETDPEHVVCRARFRLTDEEKADIIHIINIIEDIPDTVEASRNYAGDLKINFGDFSFGESSFGDSLKNIVDQLPKVEGSFSAKFAATATRCLEELISLVKQEQFTKLNDLTQKHNSLLRETRATQGTESYNEEEWFIQIYDTILNELNELNELRLQFTDIDVHDYLVRRLPTFIYMDDYRIFTGAAQLDEIKARKDNDSLTDADKTFLTILSLSGLEIDQLVKLEADSTETIKERHNALVGGGGSLTEIISPRFSQREYTIDFRADGQHFFTYVKDSHDPTPIELEERSRGFQWFFSFDLMLMHATPEEFKECVILLDEPGLHLHPEAQEDLLKRLEAYATENTLIYTTHLPFMIDLKHPDRIRILNEKDNKIVVETHLNESDRESRLVLQSALGMNASQSFLIAPRNLVVEGLHDYWILTALSNLLRQNGEEGLPEDVFVTPGGGASKAASLATFMIGQKLNVVALFDSDEEGRHEQEKLKKIWKMPENKTQAKTILFGEAVGACGDFELEDLFSSEDFYVKLVKETYKTALAAKGVGEIKLQGKDMLWKEIVGFFKKHKIENPNKGLIANRLQKKLIRMKDASELPEETQEKARKLFQAIRNALGEEEGDSSNIVRKEDSDKDVKQPKQPTQDRHREPERKPPQETHANRNDGTRLSETEQRHIKYWTGLREYMVEKGISVNCPKPTTYPYLRWSILFPNFYIQTSLLRRDKEIRIGLHLKGDNAKPHFHLLKDQQQEIHNEIGETLEWNELPDNERSRICLNKRNTNPLDENDWPNQYEWFATHLELFDNVFRERIQRLNAADWDPSKEKNVQGITIPPTTSDTG